MARISIPETCAGAITTRQDGAALRKIIERSLGEEEHLQLDFGGQRSSLTSINLATHAWDRCARSHANQRDPDALVD